MSVFHYVGKAFNVKAKQKQTKMQIGQETIVLAVLFWFWLLILKFSSIPVLLLQKLFYEPM